jgi:hypothetical protein
MKNDVDELISRLHMVEERISETEDMSIKIPKKKSKEKMTEKWNKIFKNCWTTTKDIIMCNGYNRRRKKRGRNRNINRHIGSNNDGEFPST